MESSRAPPPGLTEHFPSEHLGAGKEAPFGRCIQDTDVEEQTFPDEAARHLFRIMESGATPRFQMKEPVTCSGLWRVERPPCTVRPRTLKNIPRSPRYPVSTAKGRHSYLSGGALLRSWSSLTRIPASKTSCRARAWRFGAALRSERRGASRPRDAEPVARIIKTLIRASR